MNAPETAPLTARILGIIAKNDSKRPANAVDVLAQVGGKETEFWAAYAELIHARAIATAHIHRPAIDSAPWLAIWPTGIHLDSGGWTSSANSQLFAKTNRPPRFPAAPDPTRDPRPDLGHQKNARATAKPAPVQEPAMPKTTTSEARRIEAAAMLTGRTRENAMPIEDIAMRFDITVKGATNIVDSLADRGMARFVVGSGRGRYLVAYDTRTDPISAQPVADSAASPEAVPPESPAQDAAMGFDVSVIDQFAKYFNTPQPPEQEKPTVDGITVHEQIAADDGAAGDVPSPEVRIALWDDGSITFVDGDEITQFDRKVVERLALLLGVPREGVAPRTARESYPALNV